MSLVEATASATVGCDVGVMTQILIIPVFGLHMALAQHLKTGATFAAVNSPLLSRARPTACSDPVGVLGGSTRKDSRSDLLSNFCQCRHQAIAF